MELWQVYFNNSKGLKIKAKRKDILKSDRRFITVKTAESETEENIIINLDNVIWFLNLDENQTSK